MGKVFDRSVFVGIGLVAVLVALNSAVCLWNTRHVHHNADRVAHTHSVRAVASKVRADLRAMEASQRTFLLTGDESTYEAFRRGEADARDGLARLRELTADNPDQQVRAAALGDALDRAVDRLEMTAAARRRDGAEGAGRLVAEGVSRRHLDEADRLVGAIEEAEQLLLADRSQANDRSYANALLFGTAAAGSGLLAVGMFVWLLRRSTRNHGEAAAAVERERELLDATLTSIGDGVIATDAAGKVTFLNGVAQMLTGWTQADAAGQPLSEVFDIVNETTREPVDNPALRALEQGVIVGLANHTILLARDGAERPIDDSAAPIRTRGKVSGAVLVFRDISDRKAAEAELARANAETARQKRLYDTILSATPDFVYVFSLDHQVLYANDALIAMWGRGREGAIGKTFLEIGYPAWHAEMHDREIDQVRATKAPIRGEVPFDGTLGRRMYDYIFVPVFGADGEVEAVAGTTRDVTDRKDREERLRLLDAVGEAVRPAADPVAVMTETTRLLGEHLGATRVAYADLEPDGDRFTIRHDWTAAGAASTVGTYSLGAFGPRAVVELRAGRTLVVRDVDAELAPAEGGGTFNAIGIKAIVCCPLVKGGRLVAMMAAHQSVPRNWNAAEVALVEEIVERSWAHVERVGAAAAMRASDERFRIVARATNDAVWDWDLRTNAVWWNEGVSSLFGFRRQDVGSDGGWWSGQIHPDDRERVMTGIHTVVDHGGSNWSDEYRFRKADGRYATVLDRGYAIHDAGKTIRLVGAMQDVTERRRAEEALRRSEEQYRTLFTSIDQGFCVVEMLFDGERPVDYRFREANPTFGRQSGLADPVGRTARELVPELEAHWFEAYGRVAVTGEPARFEMGSEAMGRWFEVHAARVGPSASHAVAILFTDVSERKAAERERERLLREVEAERTRLADVFRHAPAFMAVLRGPDYVFDRANDRYVELVSGRELIGRPVRDALPEVVGQGFIELLDRVYRTGEPFVGTGARVALDPGDGRPPEERFIDFVYQPLREADGSVTGILVQGIDQTERRRAEAAVRERDERLQAFVGAATDYAVIISDPDDRAVEWLGGAERITGWSAAEALGRPLDFLFTPEDRAAGVPGQETAKAAATGRAENTRWHARKDGSQFFAEGVTVALKGPGGEVSGFGKVFRDGTARKRAEDGVQFLADASSSLAELIDYESTLRRIANIAVGGFADWCAVDVLGDGTRRRLAVTRAEPDKSMSDRSEEALAEGVIPHVLRTGEPEVVSDLTAVDPASAPQGAERVNHLVRLGVRSYVSVPLLSRGRVIGGMTFLGHSARRRFGLEELRVAQDLSGRVASAIENAQLYRDLQDQDRRKDEFLATLAHELRNPLAPVRNGVQILKSGRSPEQDEKTLGMMDRQLGHMVHLVDDLLDVSRVSSGKVVLRKERVGLKAVVDAAVETTRPVVEAGGHELAVTLPEEPLTFDADRTRLAQIFANLLNNAAKYTPSGGKIALTAAREDGAVAVQVTDTGVGIPAEMLPKVFDMFTQVGASIDRSQGGLGIGLTLVKRLVELHGGSVRAESPGTGQGSTFTVRLPLDLTAPDGLDRPADDNATTRAQLHILVVDDNRDAAESLGMILEIKGHEVRTAFDGPEALRLLGVYRPHLILLDLGLPGMTGFEVARRIRESAALADVMLVALTGWGQEEDRRRTRAAGFDHHLVKPADPDAVERILNSLGGR